MYFFIAALFNEIMLAEMPDLKEENIQLNKNEIASKNNELVMNSEDFGELEVGEEVEEPRFFNEEDIEALSNQANRFRGDPFITVNEQDSDQDIPVSEEDIEAMKNQANHLRGDPFRTVKEQDSDQDIPISEEDIEAMNNQANYFRGDPFRTVKEQETSGTKNTNPQLTRKAVVSKPPRSKKETTDSKEVSSVYAMKKPEKKRR